MRDKSIITVLVLVLAMGAIAACSSEETPTPEPVEAGAIQQPNVVSAEAFVYPIQKADLAFEIGGRVVSVEVKEGDAVEKGTVIARLDDSVQQTQVADAEANAVSAKSLLTSAEVGVGEAEAGMTQAEANLISATAALAEVEANLARVKAGPTEEEIAQSEAGLAKAAAILAQVVIGPTAEDIAQAEAAVQTANAQLNEVLAEAREEDLQAAGARLLQTQSDVREAQSTYDKVRYGDPDDVLITGIALEKATLAFEAAQADYDKLVNGATPEQIATARARVAEAEAALAKVEAGSTPEQIAQAQADVARTEADLNRLLAGATDEEIAQAEAQVEIQKANIEAARAGMEAAQAGIDKAGANVEYNQAMVDVAQAKVTSAQVQVDKTQLTAPFDGVVGNTTVEEGEIAQAGSPAISLGDTGIWQIETDDLTEIDVVDVQPGAKVSISVDALPGEEFEGIVNRITPKSETKAGDVTYTVIIDITNGNTDRLKWGMTTFVDIEADSGIPR